MAVSVKNWHYVTKTHRYRCSVCESAKIPQSPRRCTTWDSRETRNVGDVPTELLGYTCWSIWSWDRNPVARLSEIKTYVWRYNAVFVGTERELNAPFEIDCRNRSSIKRANRSPEYHLECCQYVDRNMWWLTIPWTRVFEGKPMCSVFSCCLI